MRTLDLPVRWCPTVTPEQTPCVEDNLTYHDAVWPLHPAETALVMVDCWDTHPIETHLANSGQIVEQVIAPLREACRDAGLTIVHAPSPPQARLYPQWVRYAGDAELGYQSVPSTNDPTWPPNEFRQRTGAYEAFQRVQYLRSVQPYLEHRRICEAIAPRDDEFVIATGAQLHRLCRHRGVVHLLYVGFATNMCILMRDYGIQAMNARGYSCLLLRDGTIGIEAAHTYATRRQTEAAILMVEMNLGVSALASELLAALAEG